VPARARLCRNGSSILFALLTSRPLGDSPRERLQAAAAELLPLTPSVVGLARTIYEERTFAQMCILADALEDAGCHNDSVLNHCRSGGWHGQGCWVLDLILAKE
jgi:hypothetical protein